MTALSNVKETLTKRQMFFGGWIILISVLFVQPLIALVRLSLSNDDASHIVLIPFMSAWLLFVERRRIFANISYGPKLAGALSLAGVCLGLATHFGASSNPDVQLSGYILSLVLFWAAGFAFAFGKAVWKEARFPFLFLLLIVPWPAFLLDRVIYLLQAGSSWITGVLFDLTGVPSLREGFVFHLPRFSIEVAKECSGIRSSMAVLIVALLVVHFGIESSWKKALFLASALFVMILKNGIRIATLTLLAMYVDPGFLYGRLHHDGGVVFFVLGLLLLIPVLRLLRREKLSLPKNKQVPSGEQSAGRRCANDLL